MRSGCISRIAGVDDPVTALERGEGFGAEEVVGVGDQGGFHGGRGVSGKEWQLQVDSTNHS